MYVSVVEKSVLPMTNISVGITLIITTFIILYHGIRSLVKRYHDCERNRSNMHDNEDTDVQQCNFEAHPTVICSDVEMKETLLHQ